MWTTILSITVVITLCLSAVVLADTAAGSRFPDSALPPWAIGTGVVSAALGGPLFAVWFSWYTVTKTIPRLEKRHAEVVLELERRHEAHNELLAANYRADLAAILKNAREDLSVMWTIKQTDTDKLIIAIEKLSLQMSDGVCRFVEERRGSR